ncbi:MAG: four helix bundle protein [Endomicrobiales bacterium]|nr:four helix bundle protein [Endomicrobiales bacterium]
MEKINSFKQLKVWQQGIELVKDIYKISKAFPKEELFGLTSQIKRASISVPSNIAEGFKRNNRNEFAQFLRIALGSLGEVETQIIIAKELNFITKEESEEILKKIDILHKMLIALFNKTK